jgi:hypothetical protein
MISSNAKQIEKNIDKFVKVAASNIEEGLDEVGERGTGIVKKNTPVNSGRLRNSMSYTVGGKVKGGKGKILKKSYDKKTVIIGTNVIYGPNVEYTSTTGSKGFMLRSYKHWKPIAEKILGKFIKKGLR